MKNLKLIIKVILLNVVIAGCKNSIEQKTENAPNATELFDKSELKKMNEELTKDLQESSHEALIKMEKHKAFRDEVELLCKGDVLWTKSFLYSTYIDKNNIKDSITQNSQFVIGKGFYKVKVNGEDILLYKQISGPNQIDRDGIRIYTAGVIDSFGNEGKLTLTGNYNEPRKLQIINKDNTSILLYE